MHPPSTRLQAKQNHYIVVNICFNNNNLFRTVNNQQSAQIIQSVPWISVLLFTPNFHPHKRSSSKWNTQIHLKSICTWSLQRPGSTHTPRTSHIPEPIALLFSKCAMQYFVSACCGLCCGKPALPTAGWLQRIVMVKYTSSSKCLHTRTFKKKRSDPCL